MTWRGGTPVSPFPDKNPATGRKYKVGKKQCKSLNYKKIPGTRFAKGRRYPQLKKEANHDDQPTDRPPDDCRLPWAPPAAYAQQEGAMAGAAKAGTADDDAITSKIKASLADQKQIGVTTRTAW
jgi:hypothetical protein